MALLKYKLIKNIKLKKFILLLILTTSCASTYYSSYPDYKATALLPGNDSLKRDITSSFYFFWSSRDAYICSGKETLDEALLCSIEKCEQFYSTLRSRDMKMEVINPIPYKCIGRNISDDKEAKASSDILEVDTFQNLPNHELIENYNTNLLYRAEKLDSTRYINFLAKRDEMIKERNEQMLEILAKKEKDDQMKRLMSFIDDKRNLCTIYGFKNERDIAVCVQKEVNAELTRIENQRKQNNQIVQIQPSYSNRYQALSNMGACLQTEGNFAACSNAWSGYTPPKVTTCQYDAFGNKITSTCRTQ